MLYRRFGRTGLQMPVFSCGGMRYQDKWQDVPFEEIDQESHQNLVRTISRSIEVGINHIETARGYGSSERQLGQVLPDYPREKLIVQTKIGPTETGGEFRKDFLDSLSRLRLGHVDLLAIHGINDREGFERSVRPGGCLEMARQLQKEGLARHIGLSTHGPLDLLLDIVRHEKNGGFDYINLHWYYIFQKNWPAIEEATRRDMGIFLISPTEKGGMLFKPSARLTELTAPLHPIVFNDLFCLSRPEVHTLSLGAARPEDFDLHVEATRLYDKRHELLPPIEARLREAWRDTLGEFGETFDEGLPEWHETPGGINMRVIVWLYALAKAYDMVEYGKMRYNLLGNAGHWFPGEKADKLDEVDLSQALANSPWKDRIPAVLREADEILGGEPVKRLSQST